MLIQMKQDIKKIVYENERESEKTKREKMRNKKERGKKQKRKKIKLS